MDKTNNKDNTNTLEKLIEETDYSAGEWAVFRKVEKNNQLQDLKYLLDEMLENGVLTQTQYDIACKNADYIIEKYSKWLDYDWQNTMIDAIKYTIEGEE